MYICCGKQTNWTKMLPTKSRHSVVFALSEDHHSLPLRVLLGEALGLLCNLFNVICL